MSKGVRIFIVGGPYHDQSLFVEGAEAPPDGVTMTIGAPTLGITGAPVRRRANGELYILWNEIHNMTEDMLNPQQVGKLRRMLDELRSK